MRIKEEKLRGIEIEGKFRIQANFVIFETNERDEN